MRRTLPKMVVLIGLALVATGIAVVGSSLLSDRNRTELVVSAPQADGYGAEPAAAAGSSDEGDGSSEAGSVVGTPVPTTPPMAIPIPTEVMPVPTPDLATVGQAIPVPTTGLAAPVEAPAPTEVGPAHDEEATTTASEADPAEGESVDIEDFSDLSEAEATSAPTATAVPTTEPEPSATPEPAATTAPTPHATATPEPTATPAPTATAEATATPAPTVTAETTASPLPTATQVPAAETTTPTTYTADAGWLWVDSDEGLLLRSDPAGVVLRGLDHRQRVFATGRVHETDGREWMQIESPARGWVARDFLSSEQPVAAPRPDRRTPNGEAPTAADWAALRECESGGNYAIVSSNGLYHGAYQFLPSTWDSIASRQSRHDLIGVLPSQASPADQDAMALALYELQGASPWPVCGQALL